MATDTERTTGGERGVIERMNDATFRRIGLVGTSLFALVVGAFLLYVLFVRVDYELLLEIIYPQFTYAFLRVLGIVVVSSVLSVVAGVIVGLARVSRTGPTRNIAKGYIEFFRGTPLLFQLFVIYLGIPQLWGGTFPVDQWNYYAAVIGLTLNHAAYIGEAIRGGIESIPSGQMEAARSLGMSYIQSMRNVVLPQAWRNSLAAIGNDQVILVKDTSLLTVLAVPELLSAFRNINSATFDAWTPIILVAIAYLMITIPLGRLVSYLERRADPATAGGDN
ncbi:amino acid ABC transporter permease [Halorarum halophilum]|uniref:Amino acid ABC transporter permease n=1 Tax=Halorarum halophilum TaxID=2743090 RepID=A0A7D5GDR7_9EURY|nr:amino acid ABC transporter permease [Halobaculum halophilum]QLG26370.1 amino acid ABC transporter permease [Halobaculum halophilum]